MTKLVTLINKLSGPKTVLLLTVLALSGCAISNDLTNGSSPKPPGKDNTKLTICEGKESDTQTTLILPRREAEQRIRQQGATPGMCNITVVKAGEGATIEGEGGVSLTIEPGTLPYDAEIGIVAISPEDFVADPGKMKSAGAVEIVFRPLPFDSVLIPPKRAFTVSLPTPEGLPLETTLLVAQEILADSLGNPRRKIPASMKEQFMATGVAYANDKRITTAPKKIFRGITNGGRFNFMILETGFVTGSVSDASGPRPNVVTVSNNTNTIVSVTDGSGNYALPISGGCPCAFTVNGFDPFRGATGSASGTIPTDGATASANLLLAPMPTPAITRDGIRNGGFERGDLSSWAQAGNTIVRQSLVASGGVIRPTEGQWMADINTSELAAGEIGSSLSQSFRVPAGVGNLSFDFNFVSEEFPEWVGSQYNDAFTATVTTPNGETTFAQTSVNLAQNVGLIGDCNFPAGDTTCGQTGWLQGTVDLSPFANVAFPITVNLVFGTTDAGDNIYDTHVLVDNMRFSTVFIDAKFLQGPTIAATANLARVQTETLGANEILSQAGMNVQIRNTQTVNTTDALVDTDVTWTTGPACAGGGVNGNLTAEQTAVLALARSGTATDVNIYYTRNLTGGAAAAFAIGPDDFCASVNILVNSGALLRDIQGGCTAGGHTLAHELGHLLISPQTAANALEHGAAVGNFMSGNCATPLLGNLNRQQSANLNRAGAPMLLP
ncbi:MAG: choice-of-anchor L domain-containing protein [Pseudomonadota bacterium]